ncbi:hypothetical protein [Roseisolibacter agri]|uniref:Uncharacterized protein n=1 Tax=Roseisolibacter agri TaxID=2014610 RepID=A0AA37Q5P5_9BACT|nr:hypothetical protein [Roseisolibacter agri]GLC26799.1 hypothetical protein rosag_33120 [Roseisolibacter agri]
MHAPLPTGDAPLRRLLLLLVLFGAVGLVAELLLLEHWDDPWQWTPLVLLGLVLALGGLLARRPTRGLLRAFRALMGACLIAGVLGVYLHYRGNVEFELEREPTLAGVALLWEAVRGATPALAPGALAQLGLLGLLYAHRHPLLTDPPRDPSLDHAGESA